MRERRRIVPTKPKRPCGYPGCPNLTDSQYCEEHRIQERRKYDKYERAPDVHKKYGRAWKRIRNRYYATHPYCERCYVEGRMTPTEEGRFTSLRCSVPGNGAGSHVNARRIQKGNRSQAKLQYGKAV